MINLLNDVMLVLSLENATKNTHLLCVQCRWWETTSFEPVFGICWKEFNFFFELIWQSKRWIPNVFKPFLRLNLENLVVNHLKSHYSVQFSQRRSSSCVQKDFWRQKKMILSAESLHLKQAYFKIKTCDHVLLSLSLPC